MTRPGENAGKATKNELTGRERWKRALHYGPVDRPVNVEFGYWDETFVEWHKQGLPRQVNDNVVGERYFGLDYYANFGTPIRIIPAYEQKVLAESDGYRDTLNSGGQVIRQKLDGHDRIPHYLKYPVETREDWNQYKKRLDPDSPERFPDVAAIKAQYENRDYPLGISAGSLFGWVRDCMGFEQACMLPHLDPAWFEEWIEHLTHLFCTVLERFLPVIRFDHASMWEDMCFKQGPMMNPTHFKRYMVPRYRRITDLLRKYGVDVVILDCDGNIDELVPLWLAGGVNAMFPLEVACGSDPVKYRQRYGRDVLLFGGVNKRELVKGPEAIDAELARLRPLIDDGGYAPHVDHRCPPDVSMKNYIYYLRRKLEVFAMR